MQTVHDIIRKAETNYLQGNVTISKYVNWSMWDTVNTIDAYLNSKHISGATDSLDREKPFFNIVTAAVNIWYRATDIDRKNIRIKPDKISNSGMELIATVLLQQWMKKARFGVFLNSWGRTLAKYGSAIVKFVEKDGELNVQVIPWNRFVSDPIDFDAIPHIEKYYKTPEQLRKMKGLNQAKVSELITELTTRKTLDTQTQDTVSNFIELYEVHGEMDSRLLVKEPNLSLDDKDIKYVQQMHIVAYVQSGKDYKDFTLYSGREKKDPYMLTHLIEEDGRTLSIGAVEYLFDAQWMQNHTVKNMKDTLDLASKLIFQTSDATYVGRNVLTAIETGDVMVHKVNQPLTRIANDKPDIVALMNYRQMWASLGQEITNTPDVNRGVTMPSGTPYSLGALLAQQSNSLFEIMTENKALALEDMMREFILPNIAKKMDSKDEVIAILDDEGLLTSIDARFIPNKAVKNYNARTREQILTGQLASPFNAQSEQDALKQQLGQMGNQRMFKPDDLDEKSWKEALDKFIWAVDVEIANENTDKQAVLTTLSSVLQTIASNPMILQDPNAKMVFGKILSETGVLSPIQISSAQSQPPQQLPSMNPQEATPPNGSVVGALPINQ